MGGLTEVSQNLVPLPRNALGGRNIPEPCQSTSALDYAFAFLFSGAGLPQTHCDLKALRALPVSRQRALLSALHESANILAELLTGSSEDVK